MTSHFFARRSLINRLAERESAHVRAAENREASRSAGCPTATDVTPHFFVSPTIASHRPTPKSGNRWD